MPDRPGRYRYRPEVLEALLGHGLAPTPETPPSLLAEQVNDLYRFELRRLRARLLAGEIAKREYAGEVIEVRRRYPLLSLPRALWEER